MLSHRANRFALACLSIILTNLSDVRATDTNLILDVDMFAGVDDAAAMLLACTLPDTKLLGVNVNVNSTYSALSASAIANYYNYTSIPVGIPPAYANTSFFDNWSFKLGEYASKVAYQFSGNSMPWDRLDKKWDPAELYRKILSEADDGSITIVSLGYFVNLSNLLNSSTDVYSELDGYKLVETKVKKLVVMGGGYPSGYEFNFHGDDPAHTAHVLNTWPRSIPITFSGVELGNRVTIGARLTVSGPIDDPVRAAYEWSLGYNKSLASWDPLTAAYAINGLSSWFEYANKGGYNYVYPNGSNVWIEDGQEHRQYYLRLKADNNTVARELEDFLLEGALSFVDHD